MNHPYHKKIALIVSGIVLSISLAVVIERATVFASPGVRIISYLLPPQGLRDIKRSFVLSFSLDSAFCFVVLLGVYMLFVKLSNRRRNDPS